MFIIYDCFSNVVKPLEAIFWPLSCWIYFTKHKIDKNCTLALVRTMAVDDLAMVGTKVLTAKALADVDHDIPFSGPEACLHVFLYGISLSRMHQVSIHSIMKLGSSLLLNQLWQMKYLNIRNSASCDKIHWCTYIYTCPSLCTYILYTNVDIWLLAIHVVWWRHAP